MNAKQIEENDLKIVDTLNAIRVLSSAVFLGFKQAIDRYVDKHNIHPSLKTQILSEMQKGGQKLINSYKDHIKQLGPNKFKDFNNKNITNLKNLKYPNNSHYQKEIGIFSLIASKTFSNSKALYISLVKKIIMETDYFISKIIDYVTQDTLNKPFNELVSNTNKRILVLANYLRAISNNPKQMEAISEISEALGDLGIEFIENIKPAIDIMIKKLNEMSVKVANESAQGIMRTFIAMSTALIAEIPGLGGIIDLVISIGISFNSAMKVFNIFVTNSAPLTEYGAETFKKSIQSAKKKSGRLMNGIDKFKQGLSSNYSLEGGSNQKKMLSSRKRIEHSVCKFKNLDNSHHKQQVCHSRTKKHIHY